VTGDTHAQPFGINPAVATAARMYDYFLGGYDNFAADRIAALKVAEAAPEVPVLARENRKFLRRAVRCLVPVPQWRPDEPGSADSGKPWLLAGLGRKPG